ncbi:hypothetical protein ACTFIW_000781 [Dictyostelium discoideum]
MASTTLMLAATTVIFYWNQILESKVTVYKLLQSFTFNCIVVLHRFIVGWLKQLNQFIIGRSVNLGFNKRRKFIQPQKDNGPTKLGFNLKSTFSTIEYYKVYSTHHPHLPN